MCCILRRFFRSLVVLHTFDAIFSDDTFVEIMIFKMAMNWNKIYIRQKQQKKKNGNLHKEKRDEAFIYFVIFHIPIVEVN